MSYVDSFVVPVPKDKLDEYKKHAKKAGKVFLEHGALSYVEAVADDVQEGKRTSYPRGVKLKSNEIVVISYITYKSRRERDRIGKLAMADARLQEMMNPKTAPFDMKRMIWGGFKPIVELG